MAASTELKRVAKAVRRCEGAKDPLERVGAARRLVDAADVAATAEVRAAHRDGATWKQIADVYGFSTRQAAQQRFGEMKPARGPDDVVLSPAEKAARTRREREAQMTAGEKAALSRKRRAAGTKAVGTRRRRAAAARAVVTKGAEGLRAAARKAAATRKATAETADATANIETVVDDLVARRQGWEADPSTTIPAAMARVSSGGAARIPTRYPAGGHDPWDVDAIYWLLEQPGGEEWTRSSLGECLRRQPSRVENEPDRVAAAAAFARRHGVHQREFSRGRGVIVRLYRTDSDAPSYPIDEVERRRLILGCRAGGTNLL